MWSPSCRIVFLHPAVIELYVCCWNLRWTIREFEKFTNSRILRRLFKIRLQILTNSPIKYGYVLKWEHSRIVTSKLFHCLFHCPEVCWSYKHSRNFRHSRNFHVHDARNSAIALGAPTACCRSEHPVDLQSEPINTDARTHQPDGMDDRWANGGCVGDNGAGL